MKSKTKILIAMIVIFCCSIMALFVSACNSGKKFEFEFEYDENSNGYFVTGGRGKSNEIVIPNSHDGLPVTGIDSNAFSSFYTLKSVEIPDSVIFIGESAFRDCEGLESVEIPSSVTTIKQNVFNGCTNLKKITLPFIGSTADGTNTNFRYIFTGGAGSVPSSLKTVILTGGTTLGESAFEDCPGIENITLPDSLTAIGRNAFYDCSSLKNIVIPDGVTSIGEYAFYNTAYYKNDSNWENGVLYIGKYLIDVYPDISGTCTVKEGTRLIGDKAFYECFDINNIEMPNSLIAIGNSAFFDCESLVSIDIPESVTIIGEGAFYGCSTIESVAFAGDSKLTSIGKEAFSYCSNLRIIEIPQDVTFIGSNVLNECYNIEKITIPFIWNRADGSENNSFGYLFSGSTYSVPSSLRTVIITKGTSIGYAAFEGCSSIERITLPDTLVTIDDRAFCNCYNLESIEIPYGVTYIGSYSFYGCSRLTNIPLPDSVTYIGQYAFNSTAYYNDNNNWEDGVLYSGNYLIKANSGISGNYTVKNGTKVIAYEAFESCSYLESIILPDSLITICEQAFYYCSRLVSIVIPYGVTSIGEEAFYYCSSLENIELPDSITSIGAEAFYNTAYFNNDKNWQNSVLYIGNYLIKARVGISGKYIVEEGTKAIADEAFYDCNYIESVTIPDSVISIGYYAFGYCDSLVSVVIPDSVTSIGAKAFYYCSNLTTVTIPDGITSIGDYTFYNCSSLTNITIPVNVTYIGTYAFYECRSITSITIPERVTYIGQYAFEDCDNLESVIFEEPNGWEANGEQIPGSKLADPETAADALVDKYSYYTMTRG